jgi:hypothetical protein
MKATAAGWTPNWFSQYRFYLSILVGTCVLGTLLGVNYLGPTTDVALANNFKETGVLGSSVGFMDAAVHKDYEVIKQKKRYAPGDAQYWTQEGRDGFVEIMKKSKDEDEGEGNTEGGEEGDPRAAEKSEQGDAAEAESGDDAERE